MAKMVLITSDDVKVVNVNELEDYYENLDCDCIDIVSRHIGTRRTNKVFDIVCDDIGLYKDNPRISAIDNLGNMMFVGNILVAKPDGLGDFVDLTDDEIDYIKDRCQMMPTRMNLNGQMILTQCEY